MPCSWELFPCLSVSKSIFLITSYPWGLSSQPSLGGSGPFEVSTRLGLNGRPEECYLCAQLCSEVEGTCSLILMTCLPQYVFGRVPLLSGSVWLKNWMNKLWNTLCCVWVPSCQKPVRITETVARMVIKNNEVNILNCSFSSWGNFCRY